jgi:beta-glucosidase
MSRVDFPPGFVWGTASSAYQIEGAVKEDGRGESVWDSFAHTPGKVHDGTNADVACDHYHRYREDVRLMKELGMRAYRFSTSWPRVLPTGTGAVNAKGLDFYSRLVDELLAAGIEPWVTLYHWDLPSALLDRGGFASRDSADWFAEYASLMARTLGDRVRHWITLNEPQIFNILGYLNGVHAPGLVDFPGYFAAAHHVHLAHGRAVQAIRADAASPAKVGIAQQIFPFHPVSDTDADRAAARRLDGLFNRWYLDAVLLGSYPEDILSVVDFLPSPVRDGDMAIVRQPIDFVGINHYTRQFVRHDPSVPLLELAVEPAHRRPGAEYTDVGWEVYPPGLGEVLGRLRTEYGNPTVVITENGAAMPDTVENGRVHDPRRIAYLEAYLGELRRQMDAGTRVDGYFVWSFTDNFEWAEGCSKRFGLVHVDYETQVRTAKDSALWYSKVVSANGFAV